MLKRFIEGEKKERKKKKEKKKAGRRIRRPGDWMCLLLESEVFVVGGNSKIVSLFAVGSDYLGVWLRGKGGKKLKVYVDLEGRRLARHCQYIYIFSSSLELVQRVPPHEYHGYRQGLTYHCNFNSIDWLIDILHLELKY